jgi:transcriptional regulator with XRE-family HTH domain
LPQLNEKRRVINDEFNMIVGVNIKRLRQRHDLTLAQLAEAADMDATVLNRIEMGIRSIKLRDAKCIAIYCGVPVESLYKKQRGVSYDAL